MSLRTQLNELAEKHGFVNSREYLLWCLQNNLTEEELQQYLRSQGIEYCWGYVRAMIRKTLGLSTQDRLQITFELRWKRYAESLGYKSEVEMLANWGDLDTKLAKALKVSSNTILVRRRKWGIWNKRFSYNKNGREGNRQVLQYFREHGIKRSAPATRTSRNS